MTAPQRHRSGVRKIPKERWMLILDADRLRQTRLFKGWSQRKMGVLCGVSQNAIYLAESGLTDRIKEGFAMIWARELGLPPGEVFGALKVASGSGTVDEPVST